MRRLGLAFALAFLAVGCSDVEEPTAARTGDDLTGNVAPEDLEPALLSKAAVTGLPSSFNRNRVMDDAFFTAVDAVSVAQVQQFLERSPYGGGQRCFLADVRVGGKSAAQAIVDGARSQGINPIVMVARMQVEKGLISKTRSPGGNAVDFAFGCGCPDNRPCSESRRGLDKQIECAAQTLRRWYDGSVRGDGLWVRGVGKRTLDPITITPANHATASLYAYTPWVQEGRGGNWLVWNVTRRHAQHFASLGPVNVQPGEPAPPAERAAWIGTACDGDARCDFAGGRCQGGICTQACAGTCPHRDGYATTFCVAAEHLASGAGGGLCTVYGDSDNQQCQGLPGYRLQDTDRYVGSSGSSARRAPVCVRDPGAAPAPEPAPQDPAPPAEPPAPPAEDPAEAPVPGLPADPPPASGVDCGRLGRTGTCSDGVAMRCVNGAVQAADCTAFGQPCGIGANRQAACVPVEAATPRNLPQCPAAGFEGTCDQNVAIWCENSASFAVDCAWFGKTCGFDAGDGLGYWCR